MVEDNISGIVLDRDWERFINWVLPLITVKRDVYYGKDIIEQREERYAEAMLMGDFHIGHECHSVRPFNAYLNFLKNRPNIYIGLMGDYIEYASQTNFINDEIMNVDDQIDVFVKAFKPFADRIMWILWGNHEERYSKYTKSKRLLKGIAREIGVSDKCYVGDPQRGVYCILNAGSQRYGVYALHSSTGATVNKTVQLRKEGFQTRAALIAQGHTHHLGYEQRTLREMTTEGRVIKRQWLVSTGCFLRDASYAETKSYPLNVVGAPLMRFYADRGKIDFVDISTDYKDYLTKGGISFPGAKVGVQNWTDIKGKREVIKKCLL